ncbi:MAG: hypothetical protein EA362_07930 [Saprospirales bacterium]|nr:MAG: hypothetical protein EA362_07930 [Saprospirales bacterium]
MKGENRWRNLFFGITACFLFFCEEGNSQTHITPRIGMELITIKENFPYLSNITGFSYFNEYIDVPVSSFGIGLDVEREIAVRFNLYYGMSYVRYETGKRYHSNAFNLRLYDQVSFDNISQNVGIIHYPLTNLGFGFSMNVDYTTNFKTKEGSSVSPNYQVPYASLIYLGANLNLRYIWRNLVVKVDYKRGILDVNNGNKKVVNGIRNPLYPQKGFGFYLGYRFSF